MITAVYDLEIQSGADFARSFVLPEGWNLTGAEARMEIRREVRVGIGELILPLTSQIGGGITFDVAARRVTFVINAALTTALLAAVPLNYDFILRIPSGAVVCPLRGNIIARQRVTQWPL